MRRILVVSLLSSALLGGIMLLRAQTPSGPPKPGPEHEKLAYFVGTWTSEGDMKPSPYAPGGKFSFTETCDWQEGHFALLCHSTGVVVGMNVSGVSIMAYDMGEKSYVYFESNSIGEAVFSRGTVEGDTWTWTGENKMNGTSAHSRFTVKQLSQDVSSYKFEMGAGSDPMAVIMEGKQTRQK